MKIIKSNKVEFAVGSIVAVMIGIIFLLAVLLPVVTDITATLNLSGAAGTLLDLMPLLIVVGAVIAITVLYVMNR